VWRLLAVKVGRQDATSCTLAPFSGEDYIGLFIDEAAFTGGQRDTLEALERSIVFFSSFLRV